MERQYIGARYVPKFFDKNGSNAWVANYSYEPLTIVTYNNNSYISKIPVPANIGNPVDNPKYWIVSSNINAQLNEEIKTRLNYIVYTPSELVESEYNVGLKTGTYSVAENMKIEHQIVIPEGAVINVKSGVTIEFTGEITAGRYQIFSGDGIVKISKGKVFPEWFGAKNDGVNDDYSAINKAIKSAGWNCLVSLNSGTQGSTGSVWKPSNRCYYISQPVVITDAWLSIGCECGYASIFSAESTALTFEGSGDSRNEHSRLFNVILTSGNPNNSFFTDIDDGDQYLLKILYQEAMNIENIRLNGNPCGIYYQGNVGTRTENVRQTIALDNYNHGCGYRLNCSPRNWSCYFIECAYGAGTSNKNCTGICITGSDTSDLFFTNCEINSCDKAIWYVSNEGGTGIDVRFSDCTFDSIRNSLCDLLLNKANGNIRFDTCYFQINDNHSTDGAVFVHNGNNSSVHFVNCWFSDSDTENYTIRFAGADNLLTLVGNTFARGLYYVYQGRGACTIASNVFKNESTTNAKPFIVYNDDKGASITGNIFDGGTAGVTTAIQFDDGTTKSASVGNVFLNVTNKYSSAPQIAQDA